MNKKGEAEVAAETINMIKVVIFILVGLAIIYGVLKFIFKLV